MSLYTYISFPRKADISCIISRIDESKSFIVGEIRGKEKQFGWDISKLPDDSKIYAGDQSDFNGLTITPVDKNIFTFNNVFTNQFVYLVHSSRPPFREMRPVDFDSDKTDMSDSLRKLLENEKENDILCRQQLYDLFHLNTKSGEIVELYTEWVNRKNIYGPPVEIITINTEQIFKGDLWDLYERTKVEIYHVK